MVTNKGSMHGKFESHYDPTSNLAWTDVQLLWILRFTSYAMMLFINHYSGSQGITPITGCNYSHLLHDKSIVGLSGELQCGVVERLALTADLLRRNNMHKGNQSYPEPKLLVGGFSPSQGLVFRIWYRPWFDESTRNLPRHITRDIASWTQTCLIVFEHTYALRWFFVHMGTCKINHCRL